MGASSPGVRIPPSPPPFALRQPTAYGEPICAEGSRGMRTHGGGSTERATRAEMGRAKRECDAPAARLPIPPSPPCFVIQATLGPKYSNRPEGPRGLRTPGGKSSLPLQLEKKWAPARPTPVTGALSGTRLGQLRGTLPSSPVVACEELCSSCEIRFSPATRPGAAHPPARARSTAGEVSRRTSSAP